MGWNNLTIAQRSQLMNLFRRNGIESLSDMKRIYDQMSSPEQVSQGIQTPLAPMYKGGGRKKTKNKETPQEVLEKLKSRSAVERKEQLLAQTFPDEYSVPEAEEYYSAIEPSVITAELPAKFNGSQEAARRYAEGYHWGQNNVTRPVNEIGNKYVAPAMAATFAAPFAVDAAALIASNSAARAAVDFAGNVDGIRNLLSDNGIQKTIRLAKQGDTFGAIKSGVGDALDLIGTADLYRTVGNYGRGVGRRAREAILRMGDEAKDFDGRIIKDALRRAEQRKTTIGKAESLINDAKRELKEKHEPITKQLTDKNTLNYIFNPYADPSLAYKMPYSYSGETSGAYGAHAGDVIDQYVGKVPLIGETETPISSLPEHMQKYFRENYPKIAKRGTIRTGNFKASGIEVPTGKAVYEATEQGRPIGKWKPGDKINIRASSGEITGRGGTKAMLDPGHYGATLEMLPDGTYRMTGQDVYKYNANDFRKTWNKAMNAYGETIGNLKYKGLRWVDKRFEPVLYNWEFDPRTVNRRIEKELREEKAVEEALQAQSSLEAASPTNSDLSIHDKLKEQYETIKELQKGTGYNSPASPAYQTAVSPQVNIEDYDIDKMLEKEAEKLSDETVKYMEKHMDDFVKMFDSPTPTPTPTPSNVSADDAHLLFSYGGKLFGNGGNKSYVKSLIDSWVAKNPKYKKIDTAEFADWLLETSGLESTYGKNMVGKTSSGRNSGYNGYFGLEVAPDASFDTQMKAAFKKIDQILTDQMTDVDIARAKELGISQAQLLHKYWNQGNRVTNYLHNGIDTTDGAGTLISKYGNNDPVVMDYLRYVRPAITDSTYKVQPNDTFSRIQSAVRVPGRNYNTAGDDIVKLQEKGFNPSSLKVGQNIILMKDTGPEFKDMGRPMKSKYYTNLSDKDEQEFQQWYYNTAVANGLALNPNDPRHNYDYRGYWKTATPEERLAAQQTGWHGTDTYKWPTHETFSIESKYYDPKTMEGVGYWKDENTFVPGSYNRLMKATAPFEYKNGGGIYIKPSRKGTFTAAATKHGMGVQEFASKVLANKENYSSKMVKKAAFAKAASGWKHSHGGIKF